MEKCPFSSDWLVYHVGEEESAIRVTLPYDAMLREKRTETSAGGTNTGWFEGFDYCYKKNFFVPETWEDKVNVFEFEGVYHRAEVWINGKKASFFPNGYLNFYVEADDLLLYGKENVIEVLARNADQPNSRWYTGAGIYRPVWLYQMPKEHIKMDGIGIKTIEYDKPKIEISIEANFSGVASIEILDGVTVISERMTEVKNKAAVELDLPEAVLWSPENPQLYDCRIKMGEDEQTLSFGIRKIFCDASKGLLINGKRVILRGACMHHDNGLLGAEAYPFAEERKIRLLRHNGYNAVRSSHNPCSKELIEVCDRVGMLVIDEYADMWYIHKTQYDYAEYLPTRWKKDLESLIKKDRNHPSVIMYSLGNEVSETAQAKGIKLCREMQDYLHEKDDRPVTCGVNIFFNYLSSMGLGVYSDKKAARDVKKSNTRKRKAVGSEFFNKLAGLLGADFMKFGATLHGSDLKTRECFSVLDVSGYNYGINRYKKDLKKYPDRVILGSETFCSDAYRFWELAKKNPAVIGDFVWSGIDYLGETGIGATEYKNYAPRFDHGCGWITAGAGRIDLTGKRLAEMAYTRVAFELDQIGMGVIPVNHTKDKSSPSAWKMTNAIESWSWDGCEGQAARVEVYTRAPLVKLFVNGKCVGKKRTVKDCRVKFDTVYQNGELRAVACDDSGKRIAEKVFHTAGQETILRIESEQKKVNCTQELCYIRLKYTDKNGEVKPLCRGKINVTVSGGSLLAAGSACPYHPDSYLSGSTDTYYGEALAIVKPDGPGEIMIYAESRYGSAQAKIIAEG